RSAATTPVAASAEARLKEFLLLVGVLPGVPRASGREPLPRVRRSRDVRRLFPLPRYRDAACGGLWNWRPRSTLPSNRHYRESPRGGYWFLCASMHGGPAFVLRR